MDKLRAADEEFRVAKERDEQEYKSQWKKLEEEHARVLAKHKEFKSKFGSAENSAAKADDVLEINAGGRVVTAKRSVLTQMKGSRLEVLFSGRWDKKLQRDGEGRIFLDVNPACFQAIVHGLTERSFSGDDSQLLTFRNVDSEFKHLLNYQLELFGLLPRDLRAILAESCILKYLDHVNRIALLHAWLQARHYCALSLLYQASLHGFSSDDFHAKCDDKGATLALVRTAEGHIFGGFASTSWASSGGGQKAANSFLFVLQAHNLSSPVRLPLKNPDDVQAICNRSTHGVVFGSGWDMYVQDKALYLKTGNSYQMAPGSTTNTANGQLRYTIADIEVFQVDCNPAPTNQDSDKDATTTSEPTVPKLPPPERKAPTVTSFSPEMNEAMNAKWKSLFEAEEEIRYLENNHQDEQDFVNNFAAGSIEDLVLLHVSGMIMATTKQTLYVCKDATLIKLIEDMTKEAKGTEDNTNNNNNNNDNNNNNNVNSTNESNKTNETTTATTDTSATSSQTTNENKTTDNTKSNKISFFQHDIPRDMGSLLNSISFFQKSFTNMLMDNNCTPLITNKNNTTNAANEKSNKKECINIRIDHNPYFFEKILDYLRLKHLQSKQIIVGDPPLPTVNDDLKKDDFEKVLKHYFPGESFKFLMR